MAQNGGPIESARPDVQPLSGAQFELSWGGDCGDGKRNGGRSNPGWAEIESKLGSLRGPLVKVELSLLGEMVNIEQFGFKDRQGRLIKEGPTTRSWLSVTEERGYYWVMLSDEEHDLRTYTNPNPKGVCVEVYVDTYVNDVELTEDLDVVIGIFREFFQSGDVSHDLLN